ncbi:MAG: trypsin-like peptidase domain-containing protein [Mogibacterium sp.]|nr:trypsin-like peptidase domain-containing protein [Mogibacterium sp.]
MDDNEKKVVSFEHPEEEAGIEDTGKTVEIPAAEPAADALPEVTTMVEPQSKAAEEHADAAERFAPESDMPEKIRAPRHTAVTHSKPDEKKYVTKTALVICMILTMLVSSVLGGLIGGLIGSGSGGRASRDDTDLSELSLGDSSGESLSVSDIIEKNADAVVEIVVSGTSQNMWGQMQLTEGAGSGVIVKEDGYIATNYHVIQGARKVQVTLHNGDSYSAQIIGSDAENDIAVIKIDAKGLTTATIGDSSLVEVGDLAVAIGNPLGQLGGTATSGIISALDRTLNVEGTTLTLMQTDAAINGGNSGGGLFNVKGELIGIVESKASAVGVEGLAFALPINSVSGIINDMIENGGNAEAPKSTPAVGIVISDVSEENAQYYGLESAGVYIAQVTGENAQAAGFQEEDRIISFNGTEISNGSEFISLVRKCKVGDTVTIVVSRKGQQVEIKTVLEELQEQ